MRLPSVRYPLPLTPNLTPMIDVVFQLIVFFTATSTMAKMEFSRDVQLPDAQTTSPLSSARTTVTVNALPQGILMLGGRSVRPEELTDLLQAKRQQLGPNAVRLYIRADAGTTYQEIEPILLAAARAGIWKVRFAVREERPRRNHP
jgi:biopolymer transport protein ExbD